jgi:hypothetical protein
LLAAIARLHLHAIPRGAGTGLTGGAVPLATDCVMVNTERLDHIRSITEREFAIDGTSQVAAVMELEAGVVTETAMAAAEKRGLVFATDPTSAWACTVGGNLAENAGGKSAVVWGTAIDNVLSFRLALPTGATCRVERVSHPLRKIQPDDEVRFAVTSSDGLLDQTIVDAKNLKALHQRTWLPSSHRCIVRDPSRAEVHRLNADLASPLYLSCGRFVPKCPLTESLHHPITPREHSCTRHAFI